MNGKLRVCRKCLPGQNNEETFYEDLSRYIQRMDEDLKVDQQIYEKRLNICSTCDRLMNGMCLADALWNCGLYRRCENVRICRQNGRRRNERWFKRKVIK